MFKQLFLLLEFWSSEATNVCSVLLDLNKYACTLQYKIFLFARQLTYAISKLYVPRKWEIINLITAVTTLCSGLRRYLPTTKKLDKRNVDDVFRHQFTSSFDMFSSSQNTFKDLVVLCSAE